MSKPANDNPPPPQGQPQLTQAQKRAAVTSIHRNLALRSGAGCGKTFVLARRFTELLIACKDHENPLSRLVALTFTDKAAMEMTLRVRKMLREFAAAAHSQTDRKKLLDYLEQISDARISTIHSFCSSLLRSHAIEAGIDPQYAVCADNLLVNQMIAKSSDQAVLAAIEANSPEACGLLANLTFGRIVQLVQELIQRRPGLRIEDYLDATTTFEVWRKLVDEHRQAACKLIRLDTGLRALLDDLASYEAKGALAEHRQTLLLAVRCLQDDPTYTGLQTVLDVKPKTCGGSSGKPCRDAMKEIQSHLAPMLPMLAEMNDLDRQAATQLAALAKLALDAEAIYSREKAQAGMLDFNDLLAATHKLLTGNPKIRSTLEHGIEQLLIDECQDTDAFQLELLAQLVCENGLAGLPEQGKLFIVGDAKQSIYRFRGAQVQVFEDLCARLGKDNQESLDISFRTHAKGLALVNHVFGELMGADFQPTRSNRKDSPPQPSVEVILATREQKFKNSDDASAAQAEVTAQRVADMINKREKLVFDRKLQEWRPAKAGDIAILFWRMTNSLQYERALANLDVPYYVVGGTGFFRQQEVLDLLTALEAVDNPWNDICLMGLLRSSMVGLDDNVLAHIAHHCEPPYFDSLRRQGLGERLAPSDRQTVNWTLDLVEGLHRRKDAMGIDEILQEIMNACGYEATLLSQPSGRRMLGNVRLLMDRARMSASRSLTLADFIGQMNELVINESRYEQAATAGEEENVVRLMTIHKAKGLEFPIVFVPDLSSYRRGGFGSLLYRNDWGLTLDLKATDEDDDAEVEAAGPVSYAAAAAMEKLDHLREEIRKQYVAFTRHEDHLVLVGADVRDKSGELGPASCFMARLNKMLDLDSHIDSVIQVRDPSQPQVVCDVSVKKMLATPIYRPRRGKSGGEAILEFATSSEQLAAELIPLFSKMGRPALSGQPICRPGFEVSVTQLCDFETCPLRYQWHYELGLPQDMLNGAANLSDGHTEPPQLKLDAATTGTIFHRCMELLDFADPQPGQLVDRVLAEMEINFPASSLAEELAQIIQTMRLHSLWPALRNSSRVQQELAFVTQAQGMMVRGKIDLIYQDEDGAWHIVDYKSNRVAAGEVARAAQSYELQMLLYGISAANHLEQPVEDATLYFLRPGKEHIFKMDQAAGDRLASRLGTLSAELAESWASGVYAKRPGHACGYCAFKSLCDVR